MGLMFVMLIPFNCIKVYFLSLIPFFSFTLVSLVSTLVSVCSNLFSFTLIFLLTGLYHHYSTLIHRL